MTLLHNISMAEAVRMLLVGSIKPTELVETCLAQIEAHDSKLNAYITVCADEAREAAVKADQDIEKGLPRGLLHGIPVALKDIYDTAGILTTCHSKLFKTRVPDNDCDAWNEWRQMEPYCSGKQVPMSSQLAGHRSIYPGRLLETPGILNTYQPAPLAAPVLRWPLAWRI